MKRLCFLAFLAGAGFLAPGLAQTPPASAGTAAEREARIAWFPEAKYGLFIHWGLYSIPAGVWRGERVPGASEWIMHNLPIPVKDYEPLAKQFNPVKFDAEAWVRLAEDAGMKYIVITAKHHDGFALFHSRASPYNIYDATPFHRDPLKELAEACARHHMRLGFYYSQAQDWHEPNGAGNTNDFGPNEKKDFDQYLRTKAEPQVRELLTGYGPVCLIWFDTPQMMTPARAARFVGLVRSLQPSTLINGRLGAPGDYVSQRDNTVPPRESRQIWEVPATTNGSWGFKSDDTNWRSPGEIAFKLVDVVSKGGNYLLNVGPTSEGVIPAEAQENLRSVGRWLKVNGEAVYGAGPTPFGEEFGDEAMHLRDAAGQPVFLEARDWRCTTKPGKIYFIVFTPGRDASRTPIFTLPAFRNSISRAYLLGDPTHRPLSIVTSGGKRIIQLGKAMPSSIANVVCVEIDGGDVRL